MNMRTLKSGRHLLIWTLVLVLMVMALPQSAQAFTLHIPAINSGAATVEAAASENPVFVPGNPSCTGLGYDFGFKPSVGGNEGFIGVYTFDIPDSPGDTVTVDSDGTYVDWVSTLGFDAVIVKGGPNANLYKYDPPATSDGGLSAPINNNDPFGMSHVEFCWNAAVAFEELTVTKTAVTSYEREHNWGIAKKVETENKYMLDGFPKIWLDGPGSEGDETATWTVDVTYKGYEDSGFNVAGEIKIENTGDLPADIKSVADELAGAPIGVDCGVTFPYTLPVDATLTCSYSQDVDSKIDGMNVATVTTERDTYSGSKAIEWGDDPTTEINETVTVKDISDPDLFGVQDFGPLTAPDGGTFPYFKEFKWANYGADGCGSFQYGNIATIFETGQSASATLKVNVQCYVGETAWAANGTESGKLRYNTKGNWATYVAYSGEEKTTTLFAGQTHDAGTVNFSAPDGGMVTIEVSLSDDWTFEVGEIIAVQGYSKAPSGNPAPGQFDHKASCEGTSCKIVVPQASFYGVHVNVERPDPDFGL